MNSKNKLAKNDLRLAFAQGNHSTSPYIIETMAIFLLLQYKIRTSTPTTTLVTKRGNRIERRVMKPNRKIRIITMQVLQVRTLEKR